MAGILINGCETKNNNTENTNEPTRAAKLPG